MRITSAFDSGNIEVVSARRPDAVRLRIRRDSNAEFFQWFHFRLTGAKGRACGLAIENAGEASYAAGFRDYWAVASYDRRSWFRVPTGYDGKVLTIRHKPAQDSVHYAYFVPFSMERHGDLIAAAQAHPAVRLEVPGATVDGDDLDLLRIGAPGEGKRVVWMLARQHPGESMAEWWMEGLLERLLDPDDALARALLAKAIFYVVPNMNPDGSRRGNLRANAAGANLNREWQSPSRARSPEVFHVLRRMAQTGVDFCLDVHGDETLPYVFISGCEGVPSIDERRLDLLDAYKRTLASLNPDFQTRHGYPKPARGHQNLTTCTGQVAERFRALAMTLEMPFKDTADTPVPETGWSPERSKALARTCLDALAGIVDRLR